MRIFLDMDGVAVNFMDRALRVHHLDQQQIIANWPIGVWDVCEVIGMTPEKFWGEIDRWTEAFWADLFAYSWFDELIKTVEEFAPQDWYFLTSPSRFHRSSSGKVLWIQRAFGESFRRYILTEHKHLLAKPGAVLIDDSDSNVARFREAGGEAVLFPQPWNSLGPFGDPVAHVRASLLKLREAGC